MKVNVLSPMYLFHIIWCLITNELRYNAELIEGIKKRLVCSVLCLKFNDLVRISPSLILYNVTKLIFYSIYEYILYLPRIPYIPYIPYIRSRVCTLLLTCSLLNPQNHHWRKKPLFAPSSRVLRGAGASYPILLFMMH